MQWTRETERERLDRLTKWHNWFAWYPVRLLSITDHAVIETTNIVWLERVKRKYHNHRKIYMSREDTVLFQLNQEKIDEETKKRQSMSA